VINTTDCRGIWSWNLSHCSQSGTSSLGCCRLLLRANIRLRLISGTYSARANELSVHATVMQYTDGGPTLRLSVTVHFTGYSSRSGVCVFVQPINCFEPHDAPPKYLANLFTVILFKSYWKMESQGHKLKFKVIGWRFLISDYMDARYKPTYTQSCQTAPPNVHTACIVLKWSVRPQVKAF